MKTSSLYSALCVAAVLFTTTAAWAGKTTVDPNDPRTADAASTAKQAAPDERLTQSVTYYSGSRRLRAVLDEITGLSGVTVNTGRNRQDWRARDLPVQVYATKIPLGKLLRAIADATHLAFVSSRVDDEVVYRIYRNSQCTSRMEAFFDNRIAEQMAKQEQAWDTALLLKDVSSERFVKGTRSEDDVALDFCRVIAELGPEVRYAVLNGETVTLDYDSLPTAARAHFERALRTSRAQDIERETRFRNEHPGQYGEPIEQFEPDEIRASSLEIGVEFGAEGDLAGKFLRSHTPAGSWGPGLQVGLVPWLAGQIEGIDVPELTVHEPQVPPGCQPLRRSEGRWQSLSGLDEKAKIDKWTASDDPTPSDFMKALSSASGLTIVYEDFLSQCGYDKQALRSLFGSELKIIDLLNRFDKDVVVTRIQSAPSWLFDKNNSVLIGWDRRWQFRHRNLVSASYLDRLKKLMTGDGIELDDFLEVARLTEGQQWDWMLSDPELEVLGCSQPSDPMWKLYAQLTAENKLRALSDAGLPLASLGIDVARLLEEQNAKLLEDSDPEGPLPQFMNVSPSDAESAAMRVTSVPVGADGGHCYVMEILDADRRVMHSMKLLPGGRAFPIRSLHKQPE